MGTAIYTYDDARATSDIPSPLLRGLLDFPTGIQYSTLSCRLTCHDDDVRSAGDSLEPSGGVGLGRTTAGREHQRLLLWIQRPAIRAVPNSLVPR